MATVAEIHQAEVSVRDQRLANAKLLQLDESKVGDAGELAAKVFHLATLDPLKFDALLGKTDVAKLFARGALHFGGTREFT
jgi:hypothetical protein